MPTDLKFQKNLNVITLLHNFRTLEQWKWRLYYRLLPTAKTNCVLLDLPISVTFHDVRFVVSCVAYRNTASHVSSHVVLCASLHVQHAFMYS